MFELIERFMNCYCVHTQIVVVAQIIVDALEPMELAAGDEIIKQGDMVHIRKLESGGGKGGLVEIS